MRRILFVFVSLLFLNLFNGAVVVFAGTLPPECNQSNVNINGTAKTPICYSKEEAPLFGKICPAGEATTCPSDHTFCTKEKAGWCWPNGPTSSTPKCSHPPGYVWYPDKKKCCFFDGSSPDLTCIDPELGKNITCSLDSKKFDVKYNPSTGKCEVVNLHSTFLCLKGKPCLTAIGDIDVSTPTKLIEVIMKLIVGIAGGIALIMLIFAGYQVAMSSGDPQKLQVAKEIFVSVLTGIALIALSMVLLRAIGVDLLGLPPLK